MERGLTIAEWLIKQGDAQLGWAGDLIDDFSTALPKPLSFPLEAFFLFLFCTALLLCATVAKVAATLTSFLKYPLATTGSIPGNWSRQLVRLDSLSPLLLLPGADDEDKDLEVFAVSATVSELWEDDGVAKWFVGPVLGVVLGLPAVAYRLSIKLSGFAYAPLVYVVNSTLHKDPRQLLQSICEFAISKVQFGYSVFVVVLFVAKLWIYNAQFDLNASWAGTFLGRKVIQTYVVPHALPLWQFAPVLNAAINICLFFYADILIKTGSEDVGKVRCFKFVSGLLSLFSIAVFIYLTYTQADIQLPAFKWSLWPSN